MDCRRWAFFCEKVHTEINEEGPSLTVLSWLGPAVQNTNDPAVTPPSLVSWVRAAQDGDEEAFGLLYREYVRLVHAMLLVRVPPDAAEDLVQEVFATVWQRLGSLKEPASFQAWLATITRNRAADYHRSHRKQISLEGVTGAQEPRTLDDQGRALEILDLIRALPEAYRETLVMRLVEGMSGIEIAERTGLTHQSVRVNLCRGMKLLKEKLEDSRPARPGPDGPTV